MEYEGNYHHQRTVLRAVLHALLATVQVTLVEAGASMRNVLHAGREATAYKSHYGLSRGFHAL